MGLCRFRVLFCCEFDLLDYNLLATVGCYCLLLGCLFSCLILLSEFKVLV